VSAHLAIPKMTGLADSEIPQAGGEVGLPEEYAALQFARELVVKKAAQQTRTWRPSGAQASMTVKSPRSLRTSR
jgi:hypothetical protein